MSSIGTDWPDKCATPGCNGVAVISRFDYADGRPVCAGCAGRDCLARPLVRSGRELSRALPFSTAE